MNDVLMAKLALAWLTAERAARGEKPPTSQHDDELVVAADRVFQVLSGDVRWSQASPGDKAIWRGRFRDVEKFDRWWRAARPSEELPDPPQIEPTPEDRGDDDPYNQTTPRPPQRSREPIKQRGQRVRSTRERWYANIYDTIQISDQPIGRPSMSAHHLNRKRLFLERASLWGNANIGDIRYTNVQMSQQFGQDIHFYADTLYASATSLAGLVHIADHVHVQFGVGNSPVCDVLPLRELVMGVPLRRLIATRQNFWATVVLHPPDDEIPTLEVAIHLEGVQVRGD